MAASKAAASKAASKATAPAAPAGGDLGPGWAERIAHAPAGAETGEQRGPFKARRRADHEAMVRRASARGHATRRVDRAFADLPPEVDEADE